ncbi:MAG TPA: IS66 family transposase, partial [Pirellulales bacterium]|nr:IS66 family transposase [Pirellulales bacterium]
LVSQQQSLIVQQQAAIAAYQEQLERQNEQLALFKRALFSSRRERYLPSADQRLLFPSPSLDSPPFNVAQGEGGGDASADSGDKEPPPAQPARRPGKKFVFPEGLPQRRMEYPLPPEQRACSCCHEPRVVINQQVTRQLELEPAQAYVVEHVRFTYACPKCRTGEQVQTSAKPPLPIEKSPFGPSVLATIVVDKYARHLPLYREQEHLLGPLRKWLSRSVLCRLVRGTAKALRPLSLRLLELILSGRVIQGDETTVQYLDRASDKALLAYFWGFAGDAEHRYVAFDFQTSRGRAGPREILANYQGYLQSDGYSVYESLVREGAARLTHVACWAHARRKFESALYTTSDPLLHETLAAIGQLYDVEDRAAALSNDVRRALRQDESRPILAQLHARLSAARAALRPSSKLGEAIEYALGRWPALLRYLDDGCLAIDTNHLERQFRPIAIGRANWLFLGSEAAGPTAAILYTVIQSARLNEVDVLPYLTDVLRRLPAVAADDKA